MVEALKTKQRQMSSPSGAEDANVEVLTPTTVVIPATTPIRVRIPEIEIRDIQNNQLITAIEILSPVNKRKPGTESLSGKTSRFA